MFSVLALLFDSFPSLLHPVRRLVMPLVSMLIMLSIPVKVSLILLSLCVCLSVLVFFQSAHPISVQYCSHTKDVNLALGQEKTEGMGEGAFFLQARHFLRSLTHSTFSTRSLTRTPFPPLLPQRWTCRQRLSSLNLWLIRVFIHLKCKVQTTLTLHWVHQSGRNFNSRKNVT